MHSWVRKEKQMLPRGKRYFCVNRYAETDVDWSVYCLIAFSYVTYFTWLRPKKRIIGRAVRPGSASPAHILTRGAVSDIHLLGNGSCRKHCANLLKTADSPHLFGESLQSENLKAEFAFLFGSCCICQCSSWNCWWSREYKNHQLFIKYIWFSQKSVE